MNTNAYPINPSTYSIKVSSALAEEAAPLFQAMGTDISEAVNSFLRQTILKRAFPFTVEDPTLFTEAEMLEKVRRGVEEIEAGRGVRVTMEQLEAMERDV